MKLHVSSTKIKKTELKPKYGNQFGTNPLFYNPKGFWYTCGEDWKEHVHNLYSTSFLYKVDTTDLNIKKISTVSELDLFIKKYENLNWKIPVECINWESVYNDYDGLEICPYLANNIKYGKLFQTIHNNLTFKQKQSISIKKISELPPDIEKELYLVFQDNPKYLKRLWCVGWEISSGVVWKNYSKLKISLINTE